MRLIKNKKCKECGSDFTPYKSTQIVCSYKCASVLAEKKMWKKERKIMLEKSRTPTYWTIKAQTVFNTYIRMRDKFKGCISCGKPLNKNNTDAGHLWPAFKYSNIRFNEFNVNSQCARPCNRDLSGDINNYRKNFVIRYSEEKLKELDKMAHNEKKYSIDELKEIIKIYKLKIKEFAKH